ncbi:MAG: PAS domain S-box protein, partial [Rhodospirillales bacterium]|nr:PAS domain S-box protein [Rhodospirillales bacterium]
ENDCLILCNSRYKKYAKEALPYFVPGQTFENILKAFAKSNLTSFSKMEKKAWIQQRLKRHKNPGATPEVLFEGDRWIRYSDYKTASGMLVSILTDVTEMKDRERALQVSESRLEDAIESISEGFVLFDSENRLVLCNSHYRNQIIGLSKIAKPGVTRRVLTKAVADHHFKGASRKEKNDWLKARTAHNNAPGALYETRFPSGQWFNSQDFLTNDGGRVCLYTDITEQKNIAILLQAREQALRLIMETVLDAIIAITEQGIITTFNPAAEKKFGYKAAEVVGKNIKMLMPQPYRREHDGYMARYRKTNTPHIIGNVREVTGQRKDGSTFPMELAVSEHFQDGKRAFTGVIRDITEQKAVEDALRESEERYALAIKGANEGIWDWDIRTNHLFVSERLEEIVGVDLVNKLKSTNNVVLEDFIFSEIHPDDKPVYKASLIAHLKGQDPLFNCEFRVARLDNKISWVSNRGLAQFDASGRAYRMTGSMADITERKKGEEALVEAKNMAEIASRAKTEFLANVSHELRTPLNAIIGFSELMKTELFGPIGHNKYSEYAGTINDSGQHLLAIINDILDVGRIEVGELDFWPEKVALLPVFESSMRLVQERANQGGLTLKRIIPHVLPTLKADPRRLKQVLLNLLSNAVKFTPKGGAVTLKAHQTKAGTLVISVTDTGIGMKASDIPRVMTPFVQVDSRLARKYEGTGLGLPLTQALVEQHGASMKIKSKPRKGTTVSVYFSVDLQVKEPRPARKRK